MTDVPVDDPDTLRRILTNTDALLLDFDGPICSVFAGFPAHVVADQLRSILTEGGYRDLPTAVRKSNDPFDILKYASTRGTDEAQHVEAAFRAHEMEAIRTAQPTPGALELINKWYSSGRKLAIVSNNSRIAIEAYFTLQGLRAVIDFISARQDANVDLLKPAPYLLIQATKDLNVHTSDSTLIGDSTSDIDACKAAGVTSIGYANKPGKVSTLSKRHPDAITSSIANLPIE